MTEQDRGLGVSFVSLDGLNIVAGSPWVYRVHFSASDGLGYEWWDEQFTSKQDAMEAAESVVDDGTATRAELTSTLSPLFATYNVKDGWDGL